MKKFKLLLNVLCLLNFGITALQAQEAVSASGGNASGSGGSVSYTVGQVVYTHNTGSTGTVTQGVQQPFLIETSTKEIKGINLVCSTFPNPATDYLVLKIEGAIRKQYIASLYNVNGKLLQNCKVDGNETIIPMRNLSPSTYFLKVVQTRHAAPQKVVQTFKIIKQ